MGERVVDQESGVELEVEELAAVELLRIRQELVAIRKAARMAAAALVLLLVLAWISAAQVLG